MRAWRSSTAAARDFWLGKYISDPILVSTVEAQAFGAWNAALAGLETNAALNAYWMVSVYVLKADGTVRGYIVDAHNDTLGSELTTSEDGQVLGFAGAAVSGCISTDRIACEVWMHTSNSMGSSYTGTFYYNGATAVTESTTTDAGSYIETPQDLFTSAGAVVPLGAAACLATPTLAITALTTIALATAGVATPTLSLTAPTRLTLGTAAGLATPTLDLSAGTPSEPAVIPLVAASGTAVPTLALTAPTRITLETAAGLATPTLALRAATRVTLETAASTATPTMALRAPTRVTLESAVGAATPTLALTAPARVTLQAAGASASPTLALAALTRVPLETASAQSSATLTVYIPSAAVNVPLAAATATATPALSLTAPTRITLGTSSATASPTLTLRAPTTIPLIASSGQSMATLIVSAGPGVIPAGAASAQSSATLALRASTQVPLGTASAASSATLALIAPTAGVQLPLNPSSATASATLALRARTLVVFDPASGQAIATPGAGCTRTGGAGPVERHIPGHAHAGPVRWPVRRVRIHVNPRGRGQRTQRGRAQQCEDGREDEGERMISLHQGDTKPLDRTLRRGASAIDLTGSAVEFHMQQRDGDKAVTITCSLPDAAAGETRATWAVGDVDTAGTYDAEWQITYSSGVIETIPNTGTEPLVIHADIAD